MRRTVALALALFLLGGRSADGDALEDAQAYANLEELRALAGDLRADVIADPDGSESVIAELEAFDDALEQVQVALMEETPTELRDRLQGVALLRLGLLQRISDGQLAVTEAELLLANALYADVSVYIGTRGRD